MLGQRIHSSAWEAEPHTKHSNNLCGSADDVCADHLLPPIAATGRVQRKLMAAFQNGTAPAGGNSTAAGARAKAAPAPQKGAKPAAKPKPTAKVANATAARAKAVSPAPKKPAAKSSGARARDSKYGA
jgi:hypothetical protein